MATAELRGAVNWTADRLVSSDRTRGGREHHDEGSDIVVRVPSNGRAGTLARGLKAALDLTKSAKAKR